jgi:hypothetical protein
MKKEELIHTHALLAELRNHIARTDDTSINVPEYDAMSVNPVAIHLGKGQHEDAVFALANGLAAYESPTVEATATAVAPADD